MASERPRALAPIGRESALADGSADLELGRSDPTVQPHRFAFESSRPARSDRSFTVGERVLRRNRGEAWKLGYVTQVDPLKVTLSVDDPRAKGYSWDEVCKMDVSGSKSERGQPAPDRSFKVGERVMRRDRGEEWKPGYVTRVDPLKVTKSSDDPGAIGFSWDEVKKMDGTEEVRRKESVSRKLISNLFALVLLD